MDLLVKVLFVITSNMIRLFRMFMYVVAYIGFKPIKAYVREIFDNAGVGPDGAAPHNIIVHSDWFYHRLARDGTLGLAEAYLDGWWDCKKLDEFFYKALKAGLYQKVTFPWDRLINYLDFHAFNLQTVARSYEVADKHYDLGG